MKVKIKVFNMANMNANGSIKIHLTGYIELDGNEIVNCDTNTYRKRNRCNR